MLGGFFDNIRSLIGRELLARNAIREALHSQANIDVPVEKISFKGSVAVIADIGQTARSVVFIKKQAILKAINETQKNRTITDIR